MTVKSSISLSNEHYAFAKAQVQDGRFASVSAVVQHGLDLLRQKAEDEWLDRTALRVLLEERQQGHFVSPEEMRRRVDALVASQQANATK